MRREFFTAAVLVTAIVGACGKGGEKSQNGGGKQTAQTPAPPAAVKSDATRSHATDPTTELSDSLHRPLLSITERLEHMGLVDYIGFGAARRGEGLEFVVD